MRIISFRKTTGVFLAREKTVTRRVGWRFLKPQTRLMAVQQAQGLKRGQTVTRLGVIRVISVRQESANAVMDSARYPDPAGELAREGFPHMSPPDFVEMLCKINKIAPTDPVMRIAFTYEDHKQ